MISDAVWKDYEATRAFIDKLDGQLFALRNLAIVSVSAVIAFAVAQHKPQILLANIIVVPAFLLLELTYKSFHEDGIGRSWTLEEMIDRSLPHHARPPGYVFGIGHVINVPAPGRIARLLAHKGRWHIRVLYLLLMLLSAVAYWFA